jgi:death on curing protein
MNDPLFLSEEEVLAIHFAQIELYGGSLGIRDPGLLRSALAQPSASFGGKWLHADLHEMAAAYLFSLVMNHPFVDGNKRVGTMAALSFLDLNGIDVDASIDAFEALILAVAAGKTARDDVVTFLRAHSRPLSG